VHKNGHVHVHARPHAYIHTRTITRTRIRVVAIEALVVALLGGNESVDCVISRCGSKCSDESMLLWESSPLILFGSVFLVRVLFLVGEHTLPGFQLKRNKRNMRFLYGSAICRLEGGIFFPTSYFPGPLWFRYLRTMAKTLAPAAPHRIIQAPMPW
jgi:hypothetical protein